MSSSGRASKDTKTEEEEALDLSIPGLTVSLKEDQPLGLKILWLAIFLACSVLCVKQVSERICFFFTFPVTLIYEFEGDDSIDFPKVTFCPRHLKLDEICTKNETSLAHKDFVSKTITNCTIDGDASDHCWDSQHWTSQMSAFGMTYTFHFANLSRAMNTWNYELFTTINDIEDWKIIYEDVPTRPCVSHGTYTNCLLRCLDRKLLDGSKCRLPFMKTVDHLPPCNDYRQVENIYKNFVDKMSRVYLLADCDCCRSCFENRLDVDLDTRELVNLTTIAIQSAMEEVESFQEQRSYVNYALFCEIGGIVGLYLGACLLTLIEAVQVASLKGYKRMIKSAGKPFVSVTSGGKIVHRFAK